MRVRREVDADWGSARGLEGKGIRCEVQRLRRELDGLPGGSDSGRLALVLVSY